MHDGEYRRTHGFALAALLSLFLSSAHAQDNGSLTEALRDRARVFDHVQVEFDWLQCRAWLKDDPFDRANWHLDPGSSVLRRCSMSIVRPHFRLRTVSPIAGEDDTVHSWIDGKRTSMHRAADVDGRPSVYIDDNRWATHGVLPYLTPFELQVCDVQCSVLDMLQAGGLRVGRRTNDEVVLVGHPASDGAAPRWEVRAALDPCRGYLPVELRAEIDFKKGKHVYWTVKTIESVPVDTIHVIAEAIFALDSSTDRKRWQIYHYKVTGISADRTIEKEDLAIRVPSKNIWFMDALTGYIRETDASGRITFERQLTAAEIAEREQGIQRMREAEVLQYEELRDRRRAFFAILGAGAVSVASVIGIWVWSRRRQLT